MHPLFDYHLQQRCRQFFGSVGLSLGGLALGLCEGRGKRATTGRLRGSARRRRCIRAPRLAALRAERQVAHLSAHERGPVADRPVGL